MHTRQAAHSLTRRTRLRSQQSFVLLQTGIVLLAIYAYFRIRGLTEGSVGVALEHARDLAAAERRLGLDVESGLQSVVTPSETLRTVANWIYVWGHWPVIAATMMWLVWQHRTVFLRLRDAMVISGMLGMVVFVSYPVAPPRLAAMGLVDTVTESSNAYRVLQPPAFVNQYAAMPSLHSGWDLLVGMAIFAAATTTWLRLVGVTLPVLMALAVVATANHFVVDVVAGVTLALAGHATALALESRRGQRKATEGRAG